MLPFGFINDLPQELLCVILDQLPLATLVNVRRVCSHWRAIISRIAAVEKIPGLLRSSNYAHIEGIEDYVKKVPGLFEYFLFSGAMKLDVWNSPLVQWLVARNELNLIPWREVMVLRLYDNYEKWKHAFKIEQEAFDANADPVLPVAQKRLHQTKSQRTSNSVFLYEKLDPTFNLHTWKQKIMHFVPADVDFDTELWEADLHTDPELPARELEKRLKEIEIETNLISSQAKRHNLKLKGNVTLPWSLYNICQLYVQMANCVFLIVYPWYD